MTRNPSFHSSIISIVANRAGHGLYSAPRCASVAARAYCMARDL